MQQPVSFSRHDAADYRLVLWAMKYLEREQPPEITLGDLTQELSITPEHWKQVIDRWVGVQPKCYLKHLALGCPDHLPMEHFAELDGNRISSLPGRSDTLSITWETVLMEEESDQRGKDMKIKYGWFESPFGEVLSLGTEIGLCELVFYETIGKDKAINSMRERWPEAHLAENHYAVEPWTRAAFEGGEVPLLMAGTEHQIEVWKTLLTIPSGKVTNYKEVARKLGNPDAAITIGGANSYNPLPWLIPCHRVLYKDKRLGGCHLSQNNKLTMLAWEAFHVDADSHNAARELKNQDNKSTQQDTPASNDQPMRLDYRKEIRRNPDNK